MAAWVRVPRGKWTCTEPGLTAQIAVHDDGREGGCAGFVREWTVREWVRWRGGTWSVMSMELARDLVTPVPDGAEVTAS